MNENQIADVWMLFKEYIDKKTHETAAERYVDLLVDHGVTDRILEASVGFDEALDDAIEYYLDEDEVDKEDDVEEDNWDYDED